MRIIISGGGTGGHLYPALAIGRALKARGAEVLYVGSSNGIEKEIMPKEEFSYHLLPVEGIHKKAGWELLKSLWQAERSYGMAIKLVREFKPDLVIGTGGYAAYPILRAAVKHGAKTMVHEANAELGMANRKLAAMVDCLCLNYGDTAKALKNAKRIEIVGMPIRDSVQKTTRAEGMDYLHIPGDKLMITITGGSQGSRRINEAMANLYRTYGDRDDYYFYHIVGKNNVADTEAYDAYPSVNRVAYEEHMDLVLSRTDLCIGRSGASFLAEIAVKGIPSILIPYPFSGGHQEKNAAYFAKKEAAFMVLDRDLPEGLEEKFARLIADSDLRKKMSENMQKEAKADALERIIKIALGLLKQ